MAGQNITSIRIFYSYLKATVTSCMYVCMYRKCNLIKSFFAFFLGNIQFRCQDYKRVWLKVISNKAMPYMRNNIRYDPNFVKGVNALKPYSSGWLGLSTLRIDLPLIFLPGLLLTSLTSSATIPPPGCYDLMTSCCWRHLGPNSFTVSGKTLPEIKPATRQSQDWLITRPLWLVFEVTQ